MDYTSIYEDYIDEVTDLVVKASKMSTELAAQSLYKEMDILYNKISRLEGKLKCTENVTSNYQLLEKIQLLNDYLGNEKDQLERVINSLSFQEPVLTTTMCAKYYNDYNKQVISLINGFGTIATKIDSKNMYVGIECLKDEVERAASITEYYRLLDGIEVLEGYLDNNEDF